MALWRDFQESLAAYWLRLGLGGFWLRAVGSVKDSLEHALRQGVLARWLQLYPAGSSFDEYAADLAAFERQMDRFPGESRSAHVVRIKDAFDEWSRAGTALKLADVISSWQAVGYGFANSYVVEGNGRWWQPGSLAFDIGAGIGPSQWGSFGFWNACAAIFVVNSSGAGPGVAPEVATDSLRALVKAWKPGHVIWSRFIIVQLDTNIWGGLEDWSAPGPRLTWGGGASPSDPGALTWGDTPAGSEPEFWNGVQE